MSPTIIMKNSLLCLLSFILLSCSGSDETPKKPPAAIKIGTHILEGMGNVSPQSAIVGLGGQMNFNIEANEGYVLSNIDGCGEGVFTDGIYSVLNAERDCELNVTFFNSDHAAEPSLSFPTTKTFRFNWQEISHATHYRLLEKLEKSNFTQVGRDINHDILIYDYLVPLHLRVKVDFKLETCFIGGCLSSREISIDNDEDYANNIGTFSPEDQNTDDRYGENLLISDTGDVLVVSAERDDSLDSSSDNNLTNSGAIYTYDKQGNEWVLNKKLKSNEVSENERFGSVTDLSGNGNIIAVGIPEKNQVEIFSRNDDGQWHFQENISIRYVDTNSNFGTSLSLSHDGRLLAVGIPGDNDNSHHLRNDRSGIQILINENIEQPEDSGAVVVFENKPSVGWTEVAYIKSPTPIQSAEFGEGIDFDGEGHTLAVASRKDLTSGEFDIFVYENEQWEHQDNFTSSSQLVNDRLGDNLILSRTGDLLITSAAQQNGFHRDERLVRSGYVFIFELEGNNWVEKLALFPQNAGEFDLFGSSIALSPDGNYLAIGAIGEGSDAIGVHGDITLVDNNLREKSGAVYLYQKSNDDWNQIAFLKPQNIEGIISFGGNVAIDTNAQNLVARSSQALSTGGILRHLFYF